MTPQIDRVRFQQSTRRVDLMVIVAGAFLRQLPQWRVEFSQKVAQYQVGELADLLHKMKGSCYAVAAFDAAAQFGLAEASLKSAMQDEWADWAVRLIELIDQIEAELYAITADADAGGVASS